MVIISFLLVALGIGLIVLGCAISIIDWNRRYKPKTHVEIHTEPTSLADSLQGLAKLAEALKEHKLGMQLIIIGIIILIIAGMFGGFAQL